MFIPSIVQTIITLTFIRTTVSRFITRTIKSEAVRFFTKTSIQRYYFSLLSFLLFYIVFEVTSLLITINILSEHIHSIVLFQLDLASCFFCKLTLILNLFFDIRRIVFFRFYLRHLNLIIYVFFAFCQSIAYQLLVQLFL